MKRVTTVLFALGFAASSAGAQPHPEVVPECTTTTTTTVHCTGDAAPYAVTPPAAAQVAVPAAAPVAAPLPAPLPAPIEPPPVYVPAPPLPAPIYPRPAQSYLDLHQLEVGGWKLSEQPDGSLWRERRLTTSSPGVWGTGLALFTIGWLSSGVWSVTEGPIGPAGFLPVFGAFANAGVSDSTGVKAAWVVNGLVQASGIAMLFGGLVAGPKKIERQRVLLAPGAVGYGAGVTAVGRF